MNDAPQNLNEALGAYFGVDAKTAARDARNVTRALARASDPQTAVARHVWLPWLAAAALVGFALGVGHAVLFRAPVPSQDLARSLGGDGEGEGKEQLAPLTEEEQKELDGWIKQLSDENVDVREKAAQQIEAFGPRALAALEKLFDVKDLELSVRAKETARRIRLEAAWAAVVKLWPEARTLLSVEEPARRQEGIIASVNGVSARQLVPLLVDVTQHQSPGPEMWGVWETLNLLTQPQFMDAQGGMNWTFASLRTVKETLSDLIEGIQFSDQASRLCGQVMRKDRLMRGPNRLLIAGQIQKLTLGFVVLPDGHPKVMQGKEGAAYWKTWWNAAKGEPEWRDGDVETASPENIAAWVAGLGESEIRKVYRYARRISDAWDIPAVRDAVRALAGGQGSGAERAREILELSELRDAGTIVFSNTLPGKRTALWRMRPDGSGITALKPGDLLARDWIPVSPGGKDLVLAFAADGEKTELHAVRLGELASVPIDDSVSSVSVSRTGMRIAYLIANNPTFRGPFRVGLFDLGLIRGINLPEVLKDAEVECLVLSPDGSRTAYLRRDAGIGTWSLCECDLGTGKQKTLLELAGKFGRSGPGLHWSSNGKYLSFSFIPADPGVFLEWRVFEVATGRKWEFQTGMMSTYVGGASPWSPADARMAIWKKNDRGLRELSIADWKAGALRFRVVNLPEAAWLDGVQWLPDGRVLLRSDTESWFADPGRPGSSVPLPVIGTIEMEEEQATVNGPSGIWFLASASGVPGCDDSQIVLISKDGKRVIPITNLPGGASSPHFYPKK